MSFAAVDRYKMKSIQGMKVPSENRLKIYSMSHFLFGASDIDEKWLKIAVSIGMLKSAKYVITEISPNVMDISLYNIVLFLMFDEDF